MARDDIEKMIADALAGSDEPRHRAKPVAHAQHILAQYVALCGDAPPRGAEQSTDVALPVAPADPPIAGARTTAVSRILKALGRLRR